MNSSIFISGIHTDIGKTIVSSILCHALDAAYWKPVQAGSLECTDSDVVRKYNPDINIFPSRYNLKMACSPHFAAQHEQLNIKLEDLKLPISDKVLIIEGAGGLFSPIGSACTNLDFIEYGSGQLPLTIHSSTFSTLSNNPYIDINKGQILRITRISDQDQIAISEKYLIDIRNIQY